MAGSILRRLRERYRTNITGLGLHRFAKAAATSAAEGARVLDAGAGDSPYRTYLDHCDYEATDICERDEREYPHVNYVCDLTSVPVEDARYDMVLCTQVLEHVPDPQAVIHELARVLKPGAALWLSTPFYFPEHEVPYDFFRYTQFGLRQLFTEAGLEVESVEWTGGYYATLAYQLGRAWHGIPLRPREYGGGIVGALAALFALVARPTLLAMGVVFARLERRHSYTARGHCVDYCIVGRKPA
jgi:SAM-dependent methyltransferase